jgi:hypothetical protein
MNVEQLDNFGNQYKPLMARKIFITIDGKLMYSFEVSEGNEMNEIQVYIDDIKRITIN